jgi:putative DNA-invertase from lambdoid prophage Rac
MRVALYCRVSTANGTQSTDMQRNELEQYAQHRGFQIVDYFEDHASGAKDSRPAFNQLMADAHQRKFDAVLVWKLDRFGRSLRHLVNSIAELEALGVAFVSLRDNLDLGTPSGRLMFQIIGAMAEFERSLIQERVKAGLRSAKSKGKRLGRPSKRPDGGAIAKLREAGNTWGQIAATIGVGRSTLVRLGYKGREGAENRP